MKFTSCVLATALFALIVSPIRAAFLVLPNAQTSSVGNDNSGSLAGSVGSGEFQDIWAKSQFPSGDMLITQLAFRLKPDTGSINATATSFAIYMSTTPVSPGTISSTFAANRGSDYTQVASGTGTLWSSAGCAGPGPCPFDIVYNLSTPFLFNKSHGFFMTDFVINGYNGVGTGEFDVENFAVNPLVGELVGSTQGALTGQVEFSDNITRLTVAAVPEPASWTLMLCSLGVLAAVRRRRS